MRKKKENFLPSHRIVSMQDHYLRCTVTKQYIDIYCLAYTNTLSLIENKNKKGRKKERKREKRKSFRLVLSFLS